MLKINHHINTDTTHINVLSVADYNNNNDEGAAKQRQNSHRVAIMEIVSVLVSFELFPLN